MQYYERIDKIIASLGIMSRREAKVAAKRGRIAVDGAVVKSTDIKVNDLQLLTLDGVPIYYEKYIYIMLNKPTGYVSSNDEPGLPCVFELLGNNVRKGLFCVGRLDKDTEGLLLITDDGAATHQLLSPKKHVEKTYFFRCADTLSEDDITMLQNGVTLSDGTLTKPAELNVFSNFKSGYITIIEGKYHQIKRMFGACGNKITYLERISFGGIKLDTSLKRGQWRKLCKVEKDKLLNNVIRS